MKLIHCADIHLNSSLSTHLDGDKQKQRRTEILHTFLRLVIHGVTMRGKKMVRQS